MDTPTPRAFSEDKHAGHAWNTRQAAWRSSFLRTVAGYVSLKRRGVSDLAKQYKNNAIILDCGAGIGSYALWFASVSSSRVVCVDISEIACRSAKKISQETRLQGSVSIVCADMQALPFKQEIFNAVYSIDALGHIADVNFALNEMLRCTKSNAQLFLHSECSDYREFWPDCELILRNKADLPALQDGHIHLHKAQKLAELYGRRFRVLAIVNPRGYFGWLLGYPEKYAPAFKAARMPVFAILCTAATFLKKLPGTGACMRIVNAATNHVETYFGIAGGGSCFAYLRKPGD